MREVRGERVRGEKNSHSLPPRRSPERAYTIAQGNALGIRLYSWVFVCIPGYSFVLKMSHFLPNNIHRAVIGRLQVGLPFVVIDQDRIPALLFPGADEGAFAIFSGNTPAIRRQVDAGMAADALFPLLNNAHHGSGFYNFVQFIGGANFFAQRQGK